MGKHINNRAVAPVIATLLLIAIAVAAAIIVYVFSIGLLGGLQSSGGQQVKQQVILEAYNWVDTTKALQLTLRNVGPANAQFSDWFVNGATATAGAPTSGTSCLTGTTSPAVANTLAVGTSCSVGLTPAAAPSSGVAYVVKIVTIDGAVFSYSVVAGSSS